MYKEYRGTMASDMTLYWGSGSPPSWTAMMMLEEKGLQGYNSKMISFSKKEHKSEEVLKLNPRGQVPTFKHGEVVVNESLAILNYLQNAFGSQGTQVLPSSPAQQAVVFQRMYEVLSYRDKMFPLVMPAMRNKIKDMSPEEVQPLKDACFAELGIWEGYLIKNGAGAYIAGKDFSMADMFFFPLLAMPVRNGLNLASEFPNLKAYYDRMAARPSVDKTWPPHYRETPNGTGLSNL